MAVPESIIQTNGEAPPDRDRHVDVLRRQRHETFREVGFDEVAGHNAVSGYSSIVTRPPPVDAAPSDSHLSTPPIDISNLSGADRPAPERQRQNPPSPGLLSPEAGLHRDGEQARLVEAVRRRQMQRREYYEENPWEWLEESASQLLESILVYGGMMEDPRVRTLPENPYRHASRPALDDAEPNANGGKNGNAISPSDSKAKANDRPTSSESFVDGPFFRPSASLPRHRQIIRHIIQTILRIHHALRWSVDSCIARMARLDPLPPSATSPSTYSTSPTYSLHLTADDILRSLTILWVFSYCILWMQAFAVPVTLMMCLCVGLIGRKVVGRAQYIGHQSQKEKLHRQNVNQSIKRNGDTVSNTERNLATPPRSIPTNDREGAIQRLQKQIPNATMAECRRFFKCVKYKEEAALKRMDEFFKWRSDCGLENIPEAEYDDRAKANTQVSGRPERVFDQAFEKKDEDDWIASAKMGVSIVTKSPIVQVDVLLPQMICSYEERLEPERIGADNKPRGGKNSQHPPPRCKDRTRILYFLPARADLSLAAAPTYSLACALYLDRRLSRSALERVTLFVDVRGGRGWANPKPWSLLPFIQSAASLLGGHFPERLERLVLFPMPASATWVWSATKKFLDPDTSGKVVVVGEGKRGGLPEKLSEFVGEEGLKVLEERRRSFFVG